MNNQDCNKSQQIESSNSNLRSRSRGRKTIKIIYKKMKKEDKK